MIEKEISKLSFGAAAEPQFIIDLKKPSLSDQQHKGRAITTGKPHSYISERAGMLAFGDLRGLGLINAVALHKEIILNPEVTPNADDITVALKTISFAGALKELGHAIPKSYREIIGEAVIKQIIPPNRESGFHL